MGENNANGGKQLKKAARQKQEREAQGWLLQHCPANLCLQTHQTPCDTQGRHSITPCVVIFIITTLSWQKADRLVFPITATETINFEQILKECLNNHSLLSPPLLIQSISLQFISYNLSC